MEAEANHPDRKPDAVPQSPTSGSPSDREIRTRILNAPIPEPTYWRLRDNALASRLSFRAYLARCLAETKPYPPEAS